MTTLLACPFCGSVEIALSGEGTWHHIECDECEAFVSHHTEEGAIAKWNRRAPPVAIAHEAVDLLREILIEIDDGPGENSLEPDFVKRIRTLVNTTPTASDRPEPQLTDKAPGPSGFQP